MCDGAVYVKALWLCEILASRGSAPRVYRLRRGGHFLGRMLLVSNKSNVLEVLGREYPHLIPHGTTNGYEKYKCRCTKCQDAWAKYMRGYRKRRMARTGEVIRGGRFVKE